MTSWRWIRAVLGVTLAGVLSVGFTVGGAASQARVIEIVDECDPASFNAALHNPNACVGSGTTTFDEFVAELREDRVASDWVFDPEAVTIARGDTLVARNIGGETHTFTKVSRFGGGFVPVLNELSGNLVPAVPAENPAATFVGAGGTRQIPSSLLTPGRNMFECLIHPWMRTVVTVQSES